MVDPTLQLFCAHDLLSSHDGKAVSHVATDLGKDWQRAIDFVRIWLKSQMRTCLLPISHCLSGQIHFFVNPESLMV